MILGFSIPLVPPQASTTASQVDLLFLYELAVSLFFTFLILVLILYFAIRYRRRPGNEVPPETHTNKGLEVTWTLVVFLILMVHFFWGAGLYVKMKRPIENAMEIHVLGKQWMWKIEHPDGIREINALHVPVGQPIKLILISQDVIHDFFIPAFRIKQDVLPGSYVTEWFTATRPGTYHPLLLPILWHRPLEDGRRGHRPRSGRFPEMARRRRPQRNPRRRRSSALQHLRLRHLPRPARPDPRRAVPEPSPLGRRLHGRRR